MSQNDLTPSELAGAPDASGEANGARQYPLRAVLALMVLALLGLLATAGFKSYRDLEAAHAHERRLLDEITGAKERLGKLEARIDSIRNDPTMLERLAREELGLVRAGDVVIVLPDPGPAALAAVPATVGTRRP